MVYCAEKHFSASQPATQSCWYYFCADTSTFQTNIFFSILLYNPITQDSFLFSVILQFASVYNIDILLSQFFFMLDAKLDCRKLFSVD